jgi:hypothetical protein
VAVNVSIIKKTGDENLPVKDGQALNSRKGIDGVFSFTGIGAARFTLFCCGYRQNNPASSKVVFTIYAVIFTSFG